jgi:uncharacterized protein YfaS (alpha-2-macroglobulin family)
VSYYPEETVSKYIYFKDRNGEFFDPDAIEVKVYDSKGNFKTTVTIEKIDIGKYELNYTIPSDAISGNWYFIIKATKGMFTEIEKFPFTVL